MKMAVKTPCPCHFLLYFIALTWVIALNGNRDLLIDGGEPEYRQIFTNALGGLIGAAAFILGKHICHDKTRNILSWLCIPATIVFCIVSTFLI